MGTLGYKNRDAQCGSQASNSCRKKNKNLPFFVHSHDRTYLYRCHGHLLDFGLERRPNQSESVAHRRCLHHERHILHHLRHRQEGCCSVSATEPRLLEVLLTSDGPIRYAFICFGGAGIWTAVPIFLSYMVTNFEGREKRAVSIAIINGFGKLFSPIAHTSLSRLTALAVRHHR
jgi:hypothetical protein